MVYLGLICRLHGGQVGRMRIRERRGCVCEVLWACGLSFFFILSPFFRQGISSYGVFGFFGFYIKWVLWVGLGCMMDSQ